jgi:hypothetical protein
MVFKKKQTPSKPRPDRIQKMDEQSLRGWLNACLMELGATYDRWQFNRGDAEEVTTIINLVKDLWDELQSRP